MKNRVVWIALTSLALAPPPAAGQDRAQAADLFVGATMGSLAGVGAWLGMGGLEDGRRDSTLLFVTSTTFGSALGGWVAAGPHRRPDFSRLLAASVVGVVGGMAFMYVGAVATNAPAGGLAPLVLSYTVGQGLTIAVLGRPPRPSR